MSPAPQGSRVLHSSWALEGTKGLEMGSPGTLDSPPPPGHQQLWGSGNNVHILNLLSRWCVKSHVSVWHPQPLYVGIYLETAAHFIYFVFAQMVICLV